MSKQNRGALTAQVHAMLHDLEEDHKKLVLENHRLLRVIASKDKTISHLRNMLNDDQLQLCAGLRAFDME